MSDINDTMSKRDLLENMRNVRFELSAARIRIAELERNALAPTDLSGVCQVCGETVVRAEHTWEQCAIQQAQRKLDEQGTTMSPPDATEALRLVLEVGEDLLDERSAKGMDVFETVSRRRADVDALLQFAVALATKAKEQGHG